MIEAFKKEINKSFKEIEIVTIKTKGVRGLLASMKDCLYSKINIERWTCLSL